MLEVRCGCRILFRFYFNMSYGLPNFAIDVFVSSFFARACVMRVRVCVRSCVFGRVLTTSFPVTCYKILE